MRGSIGLRWITIYGPNLTDPHKARPDTGNMLKKRHRAGSKGDSKGVQTGADPSVRSGATSAAVRPVLASNQLSILELPTYLRVARNDHLNLPILIPVDDVPFHHGRVFEVDLQHTSASPAE